MNGDAAAGRTPGRVSALLHQLLREHASERLTLGHVLAALDTRAYGVLLALLAIPTFLPLPVGIVTGLATVALGIELICGLERPFVPRAWCRRPIGRHRITRLLASIRRVMHHFERWCKPRLDAFSARPWTMLSGLALVILGVLLALPIPFTNYVFGSLLLAFAFAFMERDGLLLLVLWCITAALCIASLVFSQVVLDAVLRVWQHFT